MPIQPQTSRDYFKSISLLYFVLLVWQIVILSILFYMRNYSWDIWAMSESDDLYIITAVWVSIASILGTIFLSRTKLHEICENTQLREKLSLYKTLAVIKFALLEGWTINALVLYFVSWSNILLVLSIIMILIFALNIPMKEKIMASINLTWEHLLKLENPEEIVAEINIP